MNNLPIITWVEQNQPQSAIWRSEKGLPPPKQVIVVDDTLSADKAFRAASEGKALLWRGDFQNARLLLQAIARRIDKKPLKRKAKKATYTPAEAFHLHRQTQSQRARTLGMLLIPVDGNHHIPLRRAPDVRQPCSDVFDVETNGVVAPYVISLRELQGLIGAYEWRKKGIELPLLGAYIYPHYGVFAPIRSEYISLVAQTNLPQKVISHSVAFDIGTGTGVLAAVLANRGIQKIVATDLDVRAINCARENLMRLGVSDQVQVVQANLFPPGQASLIVCNPPWIPARPSAPIEQAIFDPNNRMLFGFLKGLKEHLTPDGEGWLILSDLAEHLGLRTREALLAAIDQAGLIVLGKTDVKPTHPKVLERDDPLHAARAAELTSLWRLARINIKCEGL